MASWRYNSSGRLTGYTLSQREIDSKAEGFFWLFMLLPVFFPIYRIYQHLLTQGYAPVDAALYVGVPSVIVIGVVLAISLLRIIYVICAVSYYGVIGYNYLKVHPEMFGVMNSATPNANSTDTK
jgi:hypothetical protein